MSLPGDTTPSLGTALRELFPELCGTPFDLDEHAASVIVRTLNDGSPSLQQRVIGHYGWDRVQRIARDRADRLSNPAYRAWSVRLGLPPRDPAVAYVHGLWHR